MFFGVNMDWEEYEYRDTRDLKNKRDTKRNLRKAYKTLVLSYLYRSNIYNCTDPKGIIAERVSFMLNMDLVSVKQELNSLVKEGFLRKIVVPNMMKKVTHTYIM